MIVDPPRANPHVFLLSAITILCITSNAYAQHPDSLHAYVPSTHNTIFSDYNLLTLNSLSLTKSAVEGAVAVGGDAILAEFKIGERLQCNTEVPSVIVKQRFTARIGSIFGGPITVGRKSRVSYTVHRACSKKTDRFHQRNTRVNFEQTRRSLIQEGTDLCQLPPSGKVKFTDDEIMEFHPGNTTYSCYAVFRVSSERLLNAKKWIHKGENYYQNFVINIIGKKTNIRDLAMIGFNARRTLISFCSVYGKFDAFNSRIHASIIAPVTTVSAMDTVFNGSMAADTVRGRLAMLKQPYVTC